MDANEVHAVLGENRITGELILFIGPNHKRMQVQAGMAGLRVQQASDVRSVEILKWRLDASDQTVIVMASAPEVEGILDLSAFGRHTELAYAADKVVYFGLEATVFLHPVEPGTYLEVRGGHLLRRPVAV